MRTLEEYLSQYSAYHRDRRNIATHFVGIPMIVLGVATLLARPSFLLEGQVVSPTTLVALGAAAFYLVVDLRFGVIMSAQMAASLWAGTWLAAQPTATWLSAGLGLFIVGWIIQFIGHIFEGRKPAFVDDLIGLLVGPLFITAEVGFALGLRRDLHAAIVEKVGPTRINRRAESQKA